MTAVFVVNLLRQVNIPRCPVDILPDGPDDQRQARTRIPACP